MRPVDLAIICSVILVWGVNFVVMRLGLNHFGPLTLGAMRYLAAALPAILFVKRPSIPWNWLMLYGFTSGLGQFGFLFTGIKLGMPTGLAGLVLQAQAFFTMILAGVLLRERWHIFQFIGLILAAIGMTCIGATALHVAGTSIPLWGFVFTLLAAVSWAVSNIVVRQLGARFGALEPAGLVVWASFGQILPFALLAWWSGEIQLSNWHEASVGLTALLPVLYLGWVSTLYGYQMWTKMLFRYSTSKVAPFSLLVPVVALSTAWIVLHETLNALQFIGGGLVFLGLVVNVFGKNINVWAMRYRHG